MSRAVLMSIHPEWIEKIASGEKSVEVRKTTPEELEVFPFMVYMYETAGTQRVGNEVLSDTIGGNGRRAVVGQFTCDLVKPLDRDSVGWGWWIGEQFVYFNHNPENVAVASPCLSDDALDAYNSSMNRKLYGWHITDVRMYKEPVPLPAFMRPCTVSGPCNWCKHAELDPQDLLLHCENRVQRPPQSWMYVEERWR